MKKTKVVRYTEEQFVTLLENIVNKVKKQQEKPEVKTAPRKK